MSVIRMTDWLSVNISLLHLSVDRNWDYASRTSDDSGSCGHRQMPTSPCSARQYVGYLEVPFQLNSRRIISSTGSFKDKFTVGQLIISGSLKGHRPPASTVGVRRLTGSGRNAENS